MKRLISAATLARLARDRSGALAYTFALTAVAIVAAVGAALDYSQAVNMRQKMQDNLDSAVLAAGAKGGTLDQTYALAVFKANSPDFTYETDPALRVAKPANIHSVTFNTDSGGNIVATAQGTIRTDIMGVVGVRNLNITVTSTAKALSQKKVSSATFTIKSAQGAYDKDIYFFTRDASGTITSRTLILQYDYTLSKGKGTKTYTPATTSSTTITVGDYASYGYEMDVYEDQTYTGKKTNLVKHFSDDADAAKWQKVTGKCTDSTGATNNWEDGGDANYADFVFNVTCTETTTGYKDVKLIN